MAVVDVVNNVQMVPSENTAEAVLSSSKLRGKLVPEMVMMLPPYLFRDALGDIELIEMATS